MSFGRTSLAHEYDMMRSVGISQKELWQCAWNAADAAFCSEARKERLRERLREEQNKKTK